MRTTMRPWPYQRHPSLVYEDHAYLGYYVYCPTTGLWSQLRTRDDGRELMLRCRERTPSEERLRQWEEIDARLPELERLAIAAVGEPPTNPQDARFSIDELSLSEVRIETDGTFALFFDTPTGDTIDVWPMVTFDGWVVKASEWVP